MFANMFFLISDMVESCLLASLPKVAIRKLSCFAKVVPISGSNIEYNPKFLGKIKKALSFQCLIYIINYLFLISSF